jgi:hypothetical protein
MTHFLNLFYNWSFAVGGALGLLGMRIYCRVNDHRNGCERTKISRIWVAALVSLAVLGYVLLTAQRAADRTLAIAQAQKNCQNDLNNVVKKRSTFTERANNLAQKRSDLLDALDAASAHWLASLLSPSDPEIAKLDLNDPRRQDYGYIVTQVYFDDSNKIRVQIVDAKHQQQVLDKELLANPIPLLCKVN